MTINQQNDSNILYCIPGVGANERLFEKLLVEGIVFKVITPIEPIGNESLSNYIDRFITKFPAEGRIWLFGQSFGGMLAQEIARKRPEINLIIANSFRKKQGLAGYLRVLGNPSFVKLLPASIFGNSRLLIPQLFGGSTAAHTKVIKEMMRSQSGTYIKWAILQLMQWDPNGSSYIALNLAGEKDYITPAKYATGAIVIPKAGHIMLFTHAEEVNEILKNYFQN